MADSRYTARPSVLSAVELLKHVQKILHLGHAFFDVPDHPLFIDQEGDPAGQVHFPDSVVFVGNKGKLQAVGFAEPIVDLDIIGADADHLCVELRELFQGLLE